MSFFGTHPSDGFSVLPQIAVRVPGGIDSSSLVFHKGDIGASLLPSSQTLLIDSETGDFIPHFAELDPRPADPEKRALLIRPLIRLVNSRRYVVALQGLRHADGRPVRAPAAFARIQADEPQGDVEKRLAVYFDARVFPVLSRAGVDRDRLVLAWDFTTASEEVLTGDLVSMRQQTLDRMGEAPPVIEIVSVVEDPQGAGKPIARQVEGIIRVPNFLERDASGRILVGARLLRDSAGFPRVEGTTEARFTARIPRVLLAEGAVPGRLIQYGHGFFGGRSEVEADFLGEFAERTRSVLIATDWRGMATADAVQIISDLLTQPAESMRFVDRVHQGMVDFIGLNVAARSVLRDAHKGDIHPFHGDGTAGGAPIVATDRLYYYGISQGCILGSTYLALAPAIDRAACSVGGVSFAFMMPRAGPFRTFLGAFETALGGESSDAGIRSEVEAGVVRLELLLQTAMDRIDPISYLPHLLKDPYEGSPADRRVLYQVGMSDAQVPNLASHVWARSVGVSQLAPVNRTVWGVSEATAPVNGSAMVEFDFGIPPVAIQADPPREGNAAHEGVRRTQAAIRQIDAFLTPGSAIQQFCDGRCDPE